MHLEYHKQIIPLVMKDVCSIILFYADFLTITLGSLLLPSDLNKPGKKLVNLLYTLERSFLVSAAQITGNWLHHGKSSSPM